MQKKIIFFTCALFVFSIVNAQNDKADKREQRKEDREQQIMAAIKREDEGALVYNVQNAFGIKLNTNGWGFSYEHGKYKDVFKTNIWWLEISEIKHPKEEKGVLTDGAGFVIGNPYIFGKQNTAFALRAGIGQQRLIGGKGNRNGVAVSAIYGGGLTAGLLKPYYVNAFVDLNTLEVRDVKYKDVSDTIFLNAGYILGGSGFSKGLNEIKLQPALHTKLALRFDYGRYSELLSAIELGINAEYYFQELPLMAVIKNPQFIFNGYVAVLFGKRK